MNGIDSRHFMNRFIQNILAYALDNQFVLTKKQFINHFF